MSVDAKTFRAALGRFATGITVITAQTRDRAPVGVTVNAFASVSMEPPLISICLKHGTRDLPAYSEGSHFVANILAADQMDASNLFAGHAEDRFDKVPWTAGLGGVPVLDGCLATLECARREVYPGGDHLIILGRVDRVRTADGADPLLYFHGGYRTIGGKA